MPIRVEFELNREFIYDDDGEAIGETNFVVPAEWLYELYKEEYESKYKSFDDFMDVYEPETDGEFIYQHAIQDGVLIDDIGVVMYERR